MIKNKKRVYSYYCQEAVSLLGKLIQSARKEMKMTSRALSERAGISRGTLTKIEQGNLTCEIGIVFEVAAIVGVALFELDHAGMSRERKRVQEKLNLLPKSVRKGHADFDENF